jgi:Spy/CpxP family protein refolding chaperone
MRSILRTTGALAALVLMAAPVAAQGRGDGPPMGRGMMRGGPGAMERNPAAVVLDHRDALELTAEQVDALESIRDRVQEENGPRWEQLKAAFGEAAPAEMSVEERDAFRARMQELRPVREEIRATNRAAGQEIHEILTDDQEQKLRPIMHEGRRGPGHMRRGGRGGGPHGPRGGGR